MMSPRDISPAGAPVPVTCRIAFGSVPKDGGTFTFYRSLRPILQRYGIDMRCVVVGQSQASLTDNRFWDDGCVMLAPTETNLKRQAMAFAEWCSTENIDIAIGVNSHGILASIHHLPERVRVLARCANGFDEGYLLTLVGHQRLQRIVALVPRLRDDLVNDYGVNPEKIDLIPNGIDPEPFGPAAATVRGEGDRLELGFVGRLEHRQKGVLHLPKIIDELDERGVPFRFRIVGKGKHGKQLKSRLSKYVADGRVEFCGTYSPAEVAEFLGQIDAYLFTSHFEGCPNSLLEAMMAGAVPVSWRLDGITDFLLEDGRTGNLVETGDCAAFADRVAQLHSDRGALRSMSRAVAEEARARFRNDLCGARYLELFTNIMEEPRLEWEPEPWSEFHPDPILVPKLRSRIVSAVRNPLRSTLNYLTAAPGIELPDPSKSQR